MTLILRLNTYCSLVHQICHRNRLCDYTWAKHQYTSAHWHSETDLNDTRCRCNPPHHVHYDNPDSHRNASPSAHMDQRADYHRRVPNRRVHCRIHRSIDIFCKLLLSGRTSNGMWGRTIVADDIRNGDGVVVVDVVFVVVWWVLATSENLYWQPAQRHRDAAKQSGSAKHYTEKLETEMYWPATISRSFRAVREVSVSMRAFERHQ